MRGWGLARRIVRCRARRNSSLAERVYDVADHFACLGRAHEYSHDCNSRFGADCHRDLGDLGVLRPHVVCPPGPREGLGRHPNAGGALPPGDPVRTRTARAPPVALPPRTLEPVGPWTQRRPWPPPRARPHHSGLRRPASEAFSVDGCTWRGCRQADGTHAKNGVIEREWIRVPRGTND